MIEDRLHHYVNDQGNLDRGGLVRFVADVFNDVSPAPQDPKLVQQASDMLVRLGIADDPNHSIANGMSKLSVAESKYIQGMLNPAADPAPATPSPYQAPKR